MKRTGGRIGRCVALVLVGLLVCGALANGAAAQSAPQVPLDEDARLALIDHCVLNEDARFGQYDNFVGRCKCATNRLMASLSEADMRAVAKWRKPTSALKSRWAAAWNGCG